MTMTSWLFTIPVWWAFAPHTTMPSSLRSTTRRNRSGSAWAWGALERSPCYGGCKVGVGDVLIGAAAVIADYNGAGKASHIKDKLIEMTHLNETLYCCAGPVHGLGAVAHRRRPQAQVLNEPQHPQAVLGGSSR